MKRQTKVSLRRVHYYNYLCYLSISDFCSMHYLCFRQCDWLRFWFILALHQRRFEKWQLFLSPSMWTITWQSSGHGLSTNKMATMIYIGESLDFVDIRIVVRRYWSSSPVHFSTCIVCLWRSLPQSYLASVSGTSFQTSSLSSSCSAFPALMDSCLLLIELCWVHSWQRAPTLFRNLKVFQPSAPQLQMKVTFVP